MDKLLTVIIPVYNKIAYLKQCLDSVLSQNLNKIKTTSLLVVFS